MSNHTVRIEDFADEAWKTELAGSFGQGCRKRLCAVSSYHSSTGPGTVTWFEVTFGKQERMFETLAEAIDAYNQADGRTM